MEILLYISAVLLGYASAFIVSLFAMAVYIDPEDIPQLLPGISDRRRRALIKLVDDPRAFVQVANVYRSLILVVITVCTLNLTDLALSGLEPKLIYPVSMLAVWLLFILFAEYLPRRASHKTANKNMVRFLWLISLLDKLLSPVMAFYRKALTRTDGEHEVSEEEKEEIVERAIESLADQAGIGDPIIEEDEKEMIGHIFQLDQTLVREIMSPRIDLVSIEKSTRFSDIQDLVRREGYSRYPVYQESIDKVMGILYVKDLFSNMPKLGEEFVVTDYLRPPYFVPETKIISDLLREFRGRKLHVAIVVDDYGGVAGLVTLEDILEEIVGEIQDEHDSEPEEWHLQTDGSYIVDASLRFDKLEEILDAEFQQDENDTVGGLIYDLVGSVPSEGTTVRWNILEFTVLKLDGQRILSVRVATINAKT